MQERSQIVVSLLCCLDLFESEVSASIKSPGSHSHASSNDSTTRVPQKLHCCPNSFMIHPFEPDAKSTRWRSQQPPSEGQEGGRNASANAVLR